MQKQDVNAYLADRAQDFYRLSDKIWDNAEIRFQEVVSSQDYVETLEKEGFRVTKGIAGMKTALRAEWGSGKPVIGFCGEYDALPELSQKPGVAEKDPVKPGANGHGCGHNLLGVGALMGAVGLKYYLENEKKSGTVVFFGCPAEEGGSGKTFMAREGCFNDLDCAFCWHPAPMNLMMPGTFMGSSTYRFTYTGTTSHAAAAPEKGRSAYDALELLNIGIQFLREHMPSTARIHYAVTDTGGMSPNIVQGHASGLYQIRSPYPDDVIDLSARVERIARGAAMMTDTEVKCEFLKGSSNSLLIPSLNKVMYQNMCEIRPTAEEASDYDFAMEIVRTQVPADKLPEKAIDLTVKPYNEAGNIPVPGCSDTGDVSWVCPFAQFGGAVWPVGTAAHTWQATACGKTDFAHRGMLYVGQVIASTAIDVSDDPKILEEAWKEFREKTEGRPYHCPIPADISPEYLSTVLN